MAVSYRDVEEGSESPAYTPDVQNSLQQWSDRRRRGLSERRSYEPTWHICQSYLAGRQWVTWDSKTGNGRVIEIPNPQRRERYTANVLTQYVQTVVGKLYVEDLRPDVMFRRKDIEAESVATHTQTVSKFIWDTEAGADDVAYHAILGMATFGTSAVRCYYDRNRGPVVAEVPVGPDGQPITDPNQAHAAVIAAQEMGMQMQFTQLHEGQVCWENLLPSNIIPPPGVADERKFPWLIIEMPMDVQQARRQWPEAAGRISGQLLEYSSMQPVTGGYGGGSPTGTGKQRDAVMISIGFEMPNDEHPQGRVVTWIDKTKTLLDVAPQLPYTLHGQPHHGIVFFHYHRIPGRFWATGVVEPLAGPQYQRNRARSQMIEMKDRNLGRVYARKGSLNALNTPVGKIMEVIEVPLHAEYPMETNGTPPGPWIENEARMNDEDMDKVSGLREVSMGQAPAGVSAYSAMALLAEQDDRRIGPILKSLRGRLGDLMVISLELARTYWPENKQMAIAGPDGIMEVSLYTRSMLPPEFYVNLSRSAPMPSSPAAETQKIFDIFNAAISAGQPLPIDWLVDSLEAGRSLPIPKREQKVQEGKAQVENMMIMQGQLMPPEYYDDDMVHIQVHRDAQVELTNAGDLQTAQLLELHIQMHVQSAQQKAPTAADSVPSEQGGHGAEAQNGMHANMQGAAQQPGITPNGAFNG